MNRFVITEPSKCIGCRTCEVACAMAHPLDEDTALTPQNFSPRLTVQRIGSITTAVMCRQCDDAPCAKACPVNAIVFAHDSVQVVQSRCIGCKSCVVACPYGAMNVVNVTAPAQPQTFFASRRAKSEAQKCDLCIDRADGQACITACPTNAIRLVDQSVMTATLQRRRELAAQSLDSKTQF
ncbi:4Fe-4S dicluster domain-containing protein [Uliginosibacterium sp. sgz301328]|uniref:4Fe-4S dicluster domain-containing protein n=1 Tax=Uliginosibacterium sp. sgz301328 TaxID=3243764 RepID=UPI00359E6B1F